MTQAEAVENAGQNAQGAAQYWGAIECGRRVPAYSRLYIMVGSESARDIVEDAAAACGISVEFVRLVMQYHREPENDAAEKEA